MAVSRPSVQGLDVGKTDVRPCSHDVQQYIGSDFREGGVGVIGAAMVGMFAAVPAALSLFLLLVLMAKKPVRQPDRWLGLWLLSQTLFFGSAGIQSSISHPASLWLLILAQCCLFVLGPAQYLYAASTLGAPRNYIWHAAYMVVSLLLLVTLVIAADVRAEGGVLVADGVTQATLGLLLGGSALPAIYPAAVLRLSARYNSALQDRVSSFSTGDVGWLRIWAWTSLAAIIALFLAIVAAVTGGWPVQLQIAVSFALLTASIAYGGYRGLTRPGIFLALPRAAAAPAEQSVDIAEAAADYHAVERLLAGEKPQLKPDLTAQELAHLLGWGPDRLTKALRHGGGTNFFNVINRARVLEVQALAGESRNARMSLLSLAHDAGFGSKSAFYEAFQRHAGCSPAVWRKRNPLRKT
jgi:AraC-like DNA-binding protein